MKFLLIAVFAVTMINTTINKTNNNLSGVVRVVCDVDNGCDTEHDF